MIKRIIFLSTLAFLLRVAAIFILKRHITPDIWEYDKIAMNILSGRGYVYDYLGSPCFFFGSAPLYAYFEALIHFVSDRNYMVLEAIQALISSLAVAPLYFTAQKIFDEKTAMISGVLYSFHPGLVVYSGKIHELTLVVFLALTITWFMVCVRASKWMLLSTGILVGLGILLRPTFVFFVPAYLLYLALKKESVRTIIFRVLVVSILAIVIISPWIYRGLRLYGRFIFITTTSSEHFWRGNNPSASGTSLTVDKKPILSAAPVEFMRKIYSLNEIEKYDLFKEEALKYIKERPLQFFRNTVMKFVYFWSFSPQTGLEYPHYWLAIYRVVYFILALFFIVGVYCMPRYSSELDIPAIAFLFSIFIMVSVLHSLYYVEMRHRWMIEPLLAIFSAYGIARIKQFLKRMAKCD